MAAASLIIDYILTVAVSIAAGIAAVTSAIPALFPHREALCLIAIFVVVVLNLRGVRESGRVFAVPTYLFIGSFFLMIGTGLMQLSMGDNANHSRYRGERGWTRRSQCLSDSSGVLIRLYGVDWC